MSAIGRKEVFRGIAFGFAPLPLSRPAIRAGRFALIPLHNGALSPSAGIVADVALQCGQAIDSAGMRELYGQSPLVR